MITIGNQVIGGTSGGGGGGGSTIPDPDGASAVLGTDDGATWVSKPFGDAFQAFVEPNLGDVQTFLGIVPLPEAAQAGQYLVSTGAGREYSAQASPVPAPAVIPLGGFASYDATQAPTATPVVVGGSPFAVDPADFTGTTWTFTASGSVVSGQSVTLTLYDRTAGATAATLTIGATTQTAYSAAVTTPGTARLYELRFGVSGTTTSHYGSVHGAALKIGS